MKKALAALAVGLIAALSAAPAGATTIVLQVGHTYPLSLRTTFATTFPQSETMLRGEALVHHHLTDGESRSADLRW